MVIHPMEGAAIIKAPGCPHYVLRSKFEAWHMVVGPNAASLMRCDGCMTQPTTVYGQFGKSGPTSRVVRVTTRDRDVLRRRAA